MAKRLDIFIHQPVRNTRATRRVRDEGFRTAAQIKARILELINKEENIRRTGGRLPLPVNDPISVELRQLRRELKSGDLAEDATGRHHPETGGVRTPIADTVRRILDGEVFSQDSKPDKNANSKAGRQKDIHGVVNITWKEDGWYYSGGGASDGPFNTSEEAFKEASAYGG